MPGGTLNAFTELKASSGWFVADGKTGPKGEVTIVLFSGGPFHHPDTRELFVGLKALAYCESADALSRVKILEKIMFDRTK